MSTPIDADEGEGLPSVPGYTLLSELGVGGMGVVYRAREATLRREVALKMLRGDWLDQPKMKERFVREAQLLATLNHPHVVQIYAVGEVSGVPYFSTELMHTSVADATRLRMPSIAQVKRWMLEAARGLAAVHELGIVHRDIKPENLLLSKPTSVEPEHVKVADFGIASTGERFGKRLTGVGMVLGTTGYLAPEMLRGEPIDPRADQYSLGIVFFELLARRPPFLSDQENPYAHALGQKLAPDVREFANVDLSTAEVLARLLEPHPSMRFPDAAAMVQALAAIQEPTRHTPVAALRDSKSETQPMQVDSGENPAQAGAVRATPRAAPAASPAPPELRVTTPPPATQMGARPEQIMRDAPMPASHGWRAAFGFLALALITLGVLVWMGRSDEPEAPNASAVRSDAAETLPARLQAPITAPVSATMDEAAEEEGVEVIPLARISSDGDLIKYAEEVLGDYTLSHSGQEWTLSVAEHDRGELIGQLRGPESKAISLRGKVTHYGQTDYDQEPWYEYKLKLLGERGESVLMVIEQSESEVDGEGTLKVGTRTRRFTITRMQ